MKMKKLLRIKKTRRFPIKRDREGRSLRTRCFDLFEQGKRPVAVATELNMNPQTVYRYFRDWKRLGPGFEKKYRFVQSLFKKSASKREENVELFSKAWGFSVEQLENILSQPHGLRRLVNQKLSSPAEERADHIRHQALSLALLISDFIIESKGKFVDIYSALKRYMHEYKKYREEEEKFIKEENRFVALVRKVIEKDFKNEYRDMAKPSCFSEEERDIIIRWGIKSEMKSVEATYWFRIGVLMAEGLTIEQAREKIYEDLLDKGELRLAKMMREFQDRVHPLRPEDKSLP